MASSNQKTGRCLCGAVTFTSPNTATHIHACHCKMCRNWGGGPFIAVDCGSDVQFEGEENIRVFDSSAWAERGFCSKCGSHLFYRLKHNRQYMMPVGLFQDDDDFEMEGQVFIDEKPDYYSFSNQTHNMTGAEIFAKYAPE